MNGFNFFSCTERTLLCSLSRPEFNLRGLRHADLTPHLPDLSANRALVAGYGARVSSDPSNASDTYRYHLTRFGRSAIVACCHSTEQIIIPALQDQICSEDVKTEVIRD